MLDNLTNNEQFDSRDVAAYIAQECIRNGYSYNNTKIQKLLYCVYGAVLAKLNFRICDEQPHAWPYGPVFPKVFNYIHKGKDITSYSDRVQKELCSDKLEFINLIIKYFCKYTASQLSSWSHMDGSPWSNVIQNDKSGWNKSGWNTSLRDEDIISYFKKNVLA